MNLSPKLIIRLVLISTTLLIIIFYFFAKGVVIQVSPESASENSDISIEKGLGFKAGNRFIFFPGKKTLQIESPGFYSELHEIFIDSASNTYVIELTKKPGKVFFHFEPDFNFRVFIDGDAPLPDSNFYLVDAGRRLVEIRNPLYLPFSEEISVIGMDQEQSFKFILTPNSGELSLGSIPSGASVFIDEALIGKTPLQLSLPSGLNKLVLKKNGYQDKAIIERIEVGDSKSSGPVELSLLPGVVTLESLPTKAKVMVGDSLEGYTPLDIFLEPDIEHIISINFEGYLGAQKILKVATDSNSSIFFELDKEYGNVSIESKISAEIYIGGKFVSQTPFFGPLHAIDQKLIIKKKNYRTYSSIIKPSMEFNTKISAKLIAEEDARLAESPPEYLSQGKQTMKLLVPDMIVLGAKRSEIGQRANETIRRVQLTKPFYLSIHEITNLQYSLFKKDHLTSGLEENHPVVNLSWNEAAIFCNWLSASEGLSNFYNVVNGNVIAINYESEGYRLPTEAEWSWAARTYSKKNLYLKYPWGNSMPIPSSFGNFADESSKKELSFYIPNYTDGFASTAPVGSFLANEKGIFDLGGNVSEYVNDFYSIQPDDEKIYFNYTGPQRGNSHVVKGSNWRSASNSQLRYAYRDKLSKGDDVTGFRVARWLIGKDDEK
jgi:formylglycine-generating enzyme required for sulfatase activity